MKAPQNRKVFVIGYGAATPLGRTFAETWERAVRGDAGFRKVTRCKVESVCDVVGEIPDWNPRALDFVDEKEAYNWNASFVILTMAVCHEALSHAGLPLNEETAPRTACLIGSAINGVDAFRTAMVNFQEKGPLKISPYLLPNLCANLPSGKAGMLLGFTGPVFSPQGACASGNHAIGIGARMIRDGDCDFVLAGGVDAPIIPEIIHGFNNMNATVKILPGDRAFTDPAQASRPFSVDRRGFVLSEGAGVIVLERILARYHGDLAAAGLESVIFGHIGDNHVHVNILPRTQAEYDRGKALYREWAGIVTALGGSVSAEHGIGKIKVALLEVQYGAAGIDEMRKLKRLFDPDARLNRGNLFTR
ncbi:MAG: beta-ketoacyl synthase N-terminal-like domain-containing protein [Opitutae bacterium]